MAGRVSERLAVSHTVDEVFGHLGRAEHWLARFSAHPEMATELVDLRASLDRVHVVTESIVPVDWLPDRVRRQIGAYQPGVRRTEVWRRVGLAEVTGVLTFDFHGVPATARGGGAVAPSSSGCLVTVDLDVKVSLPFVGGLVERTVTPRIAAGLRMELTELANAGAHEGKRGDGTTGEDAEEEGLEEEGTDD